MNQTVVPIANYPRTNYPPQLRGAGGVFDPAEAYKLYQSKVNPLDELSRLIVSGRVPGLNFQSNYPPNQMKVLPQQEYLRTSQTNQLN
jgi:hypothetical protein